MWSRDLCEAVFQVVLLLTRIALLGMVFRCFFSSFLFGSNTESRVVYNTVVDKCHVSCDHVTVRISSTTTVVWYR